MMYTIAMWLEDYEWLETMSDLEDLNEYTIVLHNLKFRSHLNSEKRARGLQHLAQVN